jgi:hypothetical protein
VLTALTGAAAVETTAPALRASLSEGLAVLADDAAALLVHENVAVRSAALGVVCAVVRSDANVASARVGTVRGMCRGLISCLYMAVLPGGVASLASSGVGGGDVDGRVADATEVVVRRVMTAARRLLVRSDAAAAMAGMIVEGLIEVGDGASSALGMASEWWLCLHRVPCAIHLSTQAHCARVYCKLVAITRLDRHMRAITHTRAHTHTHTHTHSRTAAALGQRL